MNIFLILLIVFILVITQVKVDNKQENFLSNKRKFWNRHLNRYYYPSEYWSHPYTYGSFGQYYEPLPCIATLFGGTQCIF